MQTHLFTIFAGAIALPLLSGCDVEEVDDVELAADDAQLDEPTESFRSETIWEPQPDPAGCVEGEVSHPPIAGKCAISVTLVGTKLVTGQGVSEGTAEMSTVVTATAVDGLGQPVGTMSSTRITTQDYEVGQYSGDKRSLGVYGVSAGQTKDVQICAEFTEHDDGGANGDDDVGYGCHTVKLICDPAVGQPTFHAVVGPEELCGDNTCNGSALARVKVMRVDADQDGVDEGDITPEACDEYNKSTAGTALLAYFHYNDNSKITTMAQGLGTDLDRHYGAYDYVALVADNRTSNVNGVMSDAFKHADIVFPPTRQGLYNAMQHLTAEGYRFDVMTHTHGKRKPNTQLDSSFEVLSGDRISGEWLFNATDPDNAGTARGGVPIVALWGTTCWQARQIDAWRLAGAKVASGAVDTNFYPNAWLNFWEDWVSGTPYRTAVDDSVGPLVIAEANAYIEAEGFDSPWWCQVLGINACAEDFFTMDVNDPNDEWAYKTEDIYDNTLSGAENMASASERVFMGDQQLTFGGPSASWP